MFRASSVWKNEKNNGESSQAYSDTCQTPKMKFLRK